MLQIGERHVVEPDTSEIAAMQSEFEEYDCLVLPQLIEPAFAGQISKRLNPGDFYSKSHVGYGQKVFSSDITLRENQFSLHVLHFVLNNPVLFRIIQGITGCQTVASFGGRIYSIFSGEGHHLEWHDDTETRERLVGISINLSPESYTGGVFQLREKSSRRLRREIKSENPGDAHIFKIAPELEHRVTTLEGNAARIAAAGWFFSSTGYFDRIRRQSSSSR
jgi:hypothetical protein